MTRRLVHRVLTTALTAGLLAGLAGSAHAQFVLYDDFSSGTIDPAKWQGSSVEGSTAAPTGRALRIVENGALRLALTSWGDDTSDTGSVVSRERLSIRQLGTLGGTGFITGMRATVTVLDVAVQDCAANSGNATNSLAQLLGWFFNDGSGGPGDRTGNVIAGLQLTQSRDGAKRVTPLLQRCLDAACNTASNNSLVPNPFSATWALNTPLILEVVWVPANGRFRYTVTNPATLASETRDGVYQGTFTNAGPPTVGGFNALDVRHNVENCSAARQRLRIDTLFDNVQVQRQP